MTSRYTYFATCPKGMEDLLVQELRSFGAVSLKETRAGASFTGPLEVAYRACLWSRIASRILLLIKTFPAHSPEALYDGANCIPWHEHVPVKGTLAVDCAVSHSQIAHSHYAALKLKDAIVDQFRSMTGQRPSVSVERPDLQVNLYLHRDEAAVSVDLSGDSLHRRGYRTEGGSAPLKENLAAALLLRARWPEIAREGGPLVDPMCGAGTLPIEAALMAGDVAPGLGRNYFGFLKWKGHDARLWERLLKEACERREQGMRNLPPIAGYDSDRQAVQRALSHVERAGLRGIVHIEKRDLATASPLHKNSLAAGLVVVNPPYGTRLGEVKALHPLYRCLGEVLLEKFPGWKAAVLTGNDELAKATGLRAVRVHTLYNGAIECKLLHFVADPARIFKNAWRSDKEVDDRSSSGHQTATVALSGGSAMFANRLRKNTQHFGKWARRNGIYCYRVYDSDIPEYAVAIDLYGQWAYVQEYEPPKTVDSEKRAERLQDVRAVLPEALAMDARDIFFRVRQRQKGSSQYRKLSDAGSFSEVREGRYKFLVNFTDYLDAGLFLDHRITRALIGESAQGRHFLNLFAYTGTATVYAAGGGAASTTSVDSSKTYLSWAQKNLALNGFGGNTHTFDCADCMEWLKTEKRRFGLIFLDPPTFSNSKDREHDFDLQRDYIELIRLAARHLERNGILIFSNNFRRFKLDIEALAPLKIKNITAATIPQDFARNSRIHNCWKITHN